MTVKPPDSAIPTQPAGDLYDRIGGWISGACLWRDNNPADELAVRYISVSKHLHLHPHTVVTDSLAELRAVLQSAQPF
jgi:hypothetical protein